MTGRMVVLAIVAFTCVIAVGVWSGRQPQERQLLREVYSPTFGTVPPQASIADTIRQLRTDLASPAGDAFLARLLPDQAAALWIAIIVAIAVAFDFQRVRRPENVDLILMLLLGMTFFDIMRLFRVPLDPVYWRLLDVVFTAITALNAALLVRAVWRARTTDTGRPWQPNFRGSALAAMALLLLAANVLVALERDPDDSGFFINLGAQRLRERGRLPYGDPLLTGTPGAAYGPVFYALHLPFQFIIQPRSPNPISSAHPPLGEDSSYVLPPPLATKLCTITLHLAGVMALFVIGVRLTRDVDVGWALVALYCSGAFIMGVGGDREFIGGMTFVSHIVPAATTLIAFACLPSPALAGVVLAISTGAGFYPAFMVPAWVGYLWRSRTRSVRFVAGFAIAAAVIGGSTWALSLPANGRSRVGTILNDTLGHHTDPAGYGRSPYGFWGQRGGIRQWMTTPLAGKSGLTTPAYLMFFGLVGAAFFFARGASAPQLALLTAAVALASSLLKIQPTGTYVAWAYPFLLIGIFASRQTARGFGVTDDGAGAAA
jgi:hypothetical protein